MSSFPDLEGTVLQRGTDEYEKVRQHTFPTNGWARPESTPVAIAQVQSNKDIQACLFWAASQKVQVSVRSGGHNWFGSSLQQDTLLIDMSAFNSIEIDAQSKTATIGPCAVGVDLNQTAAEHGLCFPTGHCPGVPMGGFLLGGGYGWFFDYYGVAAESIVSATIVTPEGELLEHITPESHPDWMWLVRGAGVTFPGIVTSFKLKLYDLPSIVRMGMSLYRIEAYKAIVEFLREGRKEGRISPKVETSVILASTPPPVVQALQEMSSQPPPMKVCLFFMAVLADTEDEFDANMKATVQHPDFPSIDPVLPTEPPKNMSFAAMSNELGAAYPAGFSWICRCYLLKTSSADPVDWDGIRETFEQHTPVGVSSVMTAVGCRTEIAETEREGAYGAVPSSGLLVGLFGAHMAEAKDEKERLELFVKSADALVQPHLFKYNVLEHPVNKVTFPKMFVGPVGAKVKSLRRVLDPEGIFFDPTEASP